MALNITQMPNGIIYREKMSVLTRLFILFIGVTCGTMIPLTWASLADWTVLSVDTVVATVVCLAAALFGVFLAILAFSPVKTLDFDAARRMLVQTSLGPLGRSVNETPFQSMERFELVMRDSEDGLYPVLRLFVKGTPRAIEMVEVGDRVEAERWLGRLDALRHHAS